MSKLYFGLVVAVAVVCMTACVKDPVEEAATGGRPGRAFTSIAGINGFIEDDDDGDGVIKLGKKLENAYSVANMKAAYDALHQHMGHGGETPPVSDESFRGPTHLYIKITINSTEDLDRIIDDSLDVFPYPLDYELVGSGEYIPPDGEENIVYTVVPVDYDLSGLTYDLIEECIIPDEDDEEFIEVEKMSLQMTGNWNVDDEEGDQVASLIPSSWKRYPHGSIRVYNTVTGAYEGVRNMKVVFNTLVRIRSAYTDTGGHYSSDKWFLTNVNYTLAFCNKAGFALWRNNWCLLPATVCKGIHTSKNDYSVNINTGTSAWRPATVNNAIDIYQNILCNKVGISQPINNLRVGLMGEPKSDSNNWTGSTPMFHHMISNLSLPEYGALLCLTEGSWILSILLPDMFVFDHAKSTDHIYSTVLHEMTHVSHFAQAGAEYWNKYILGTILRSGYGSGYSNSIGFDGYIGVGEMWGYYAGYVMDSVCWRKVYNKNFTDSVHHSDDWFRPKILKTLTDSFQCITPAQIYDCLRPWVTDHCSLCDELKIRACPEYAPFISPYFKEFCSDD